MSFDQNTHCKTVDLQNMVIVQTDQEKMAIIVDGYVYRQVDKLKNACSV